MTYTFLTSAWRSFSQQDIKQCRSMWKFSQLSAKIIEVCIYQKSCLLQAIISHNGLLHFRKWNMANITLNCLIIPTGGFTRISNNNANLTVTIPLKNTIRNLHAQIQQQLLQQFRNVPFYLRALRPGLVNYVAMRQGDWFLIILMKTSLRAFTMFL